MHRRNPRPWLRADPLVVVLVLLGLTAVAGFGVQQASPDSQVSVFWLLMAAVHASLAVTSGQIARTGPATHRRLWLWFSAAGSAFLLGDLSQLLLAVRLPLSPSTVIGTEFLFGSVGAGMVLLVTGLLRTRWGT